MSTSSIPMVNLRLSMTKLNKLSPLTPRRNKNRESGRRLTKSSPPSHEVDLSDDTSEEPIPWCELHCRRSYKLVCCAIFLVLAIISIIVVIVYYQTHPGIVRERRPDTVNRNDRYPFGIAPPSWSTSTSANSPNTDNDPKLRNFVVDKTSPQDVFTEMSSSGKGNTTVVVDSGTTPSQPSDLTGESKKPESIIESNKEELTKMKLGEIHGVDIENSVPNSAILTNRSFWIESSQGTTGQGSVSTVVNETKDSAHLHHKLYSRIAQILSPTVAYVSVLNTLSENSIHFSVNLPTYEETSAVFRFNSTDQKTTSNPIDPVPANLSLLDEISPSVTANVSLNLTENLGENDNLTTAHYTEQNFNTYENGKSRANFTPANLENSPIFIQNLSSDNGFYETTGRNLTGDRSIERARNFRQNFTGAGNTEGNFTGFNSSEVGSTKTSRTFNRTNDKRLGNFTQTSTGERFTSPISNSRTEFGTGENSTTSNHDLSVNVNLTTSKNIPDFVTYKPNVLEVRGSGKNLTSRNDSESSENSQTSERNLPAARKFHDNFTHLTAASTEINPSAKSIFSRNLTDLDTSDENSTSRVSNQTSSNFDKNSTLGEVYSTPSSITENDKSTINLTVNNSNETSETTEKTSNISVENATATNTNFTTYYDNVTNVNLTARVLDNNTIDLSKNSSFQHDSSIFLKSVVTKTSTSALPEVVNSTANNSSTFTEASVQFAPTYSEPNHPDDTVNVILTL